MNTSTRNSDYLRGVLAGAPFVLVAAPFGILFGVVAIEAGLDVVQAMWFTTLVIAGAAQFAAIGQMVENAPTLVVIATALAVNLRMAMYSASLALYLGAAPFWQRALIAYFNFDQTYAMSVAEFENRPEMTVSQRVAYFFGTTTLIVPTWIGSSYLGAVLGGQIPESVPLDFALPIMFIAVFAPMLKTLAHVAAAVASVFLALLFRDVPYDMGLLLAAFGAMIVGAQVEVWTKRAVK